MQIIQTHPRQSECDNTSGLLQTSHMELTSFPHVNAGPLGTRTDFFLIIAFLIRLLWHIKVPIINVLKWCWKQRACYVWKEIICHSQITASCTFNESQWQGVTDRHTAPPDIRPAAAKHRIQVRSCVSTWRGTCNSTQEDPQPGTGHGNVSLRGFIANNWSTVSPTCPSPNQNIKNKAWASEFVITQEAFAACLMGLRWERSGLILTGLTSQQQRWNYLIPATHTNPFWRVYHMAPNDAPVNARQVVSVLDVTDVHKSHFCKYNCNRKNS